MARRRRNACGACGRAARGGEKLQGFAVRVGKRWIARFTYPSMGTGVAFSTAKKIDAAWEKGEGTKIAEACRAVLGERFFVWHEEGGWEPAAKVAQLFVDRGGGDALVEWVCPACVKNAARAGA